MERLREFSSEMDEDTLRHILLNAGIPLQKWGAGNAKTITHLLEEVKSGETELSWNENGELIRNVIVVQVDVFTQEPDGQRWYLREDKQVFRDGRVRHRELSTTLGEKMKPEEDILAAARRAVSEELGISEVDEMCYTGSERMMHSSDSYPGLESQYESHHVVIALPAAALNTEGYKEVQTDKTTYFVWERVED